MERETREERDATERLNTCLSLQQASVGPHDCLKLTNFKTLTMCKKERMTGRKEEAKRFLSSRFRVLFAFTGSL